MQTKDEIAACFWEALDSLILNPNITEISIKNDPIYYLKKTDYRIEIRSNTSTTWYAYVIKPTPGDTAYRDHLLRKYYILRSVEED